MALAALLVGTWISISMSRRIARAMRMILARAEAIATGDLTSDDLEVISEDEMGDLTRMINRMNANVKAIILAITNSAQQVALASEQMSGTGEQITANSEETTGQANLVTQATQQVSQTAKRLPALARSRPPSRTSPATPTPPPPVASNAVLTAQGATSNVGKLGQSSAEIGEVVKVITTMASKLTCLSSLSRRRTPANPGKASPSWPTR